MAAGAVMVKLKVFCWPGSIESPDESRTRERAGQVFDRGLSSAGMARQFAAIVASGSRNEALGSVTVPTLVIHGDADPLVRVEGGIDTAHSIPGADYHFQTRAVDWEWLAGRHPLAPPVWENPAGAHTAVLENIITMALKVFDRYNHCRIF